MAPETPGGQPRHGAGPPWDPWARPPGGEYRPPEVQPEVAYRPPAGHQAQPSLDQRQPAHHRLPARRPPDRSRWHWLLLAGVVIPLLTPLYERVHPELWGVPFFYWCQMAFAVMAAAVTATVQLATRKKRGP